MGGIARSYPLAFRQFPCWKTYYVIDPYTLYIYLSSIESVNLSHLIIYVYENGASFLFKTTGIFISVSLSYSALDTISSNLSVNARFLALDVSGM